MQDFVYQSYVITQPAPRLGSPLQDKKRHLDPAELLSSHLLPMTDSHSELSGAPKMRVEGVRDSQLLKMAGNSMNTACIGLFLLSAILCLDPKPK